MIRVRTKSGKMFHARTKLPNTSYFSLYRRAIDTHPELIGVCEKWISNQLLDTNNHTVNTSLLFDIFRSDDPNYHKLATACGSPKNSYGLFEQIAWTYFFDDSRIWIATPVAQPCKEAWQEREYRLESEWLRVITLENSEIRNHLRMDSEIGAVTTLEGYSTDAEFRPELRIGDVVRALVPPFTGQTGPVLELLPETESLRARMIVLNKPKSVRFKVYQVEKVG